jgi:beta-lactamase class A
MIRSALLVLLWLGLVTPALAQAPSPALSGRADQVVALLRGRGDPDAMFTPAFLAQVPAAQVRAVAAQLTGQYGAVRGLDRLDIASPQAGVIHVAFERAIVHIQIAIEPQPPHRIAGLLLTGADVSGDTLAGLIGEIRALPGTASVAVARLGDGAPERLAALEPDRPLAIGSTFKLFILAELSRQVAAGERRWSDVATLDRRSFPAGTLGTWPRGAPVTLHTLASLMISVSDNSAADMLLHILGRENVERMMVTLGVEAAARNRPLLSTLEMAALKTGPAPALNAWQQADEAGRRRMLAQYADADPARIEVARFTGNPLHIDSVEWFASSADLVRVMDWLRRHGGETALAILAINSALGPQLRGELAYAGYKGGSETGVLNLTWLVRSRAGAWHVVTGSWNNPAAPLDEERFIGLMTRAVRIVR